MIDYVSSYIKTLLINVRFTSMRVRQMRNLCTEIYKTLSNLNPQYMQELHVWEELNQLIHKKTKWPKNSHSESGVIWFPKHQIWRVHTLE